MPASPKVKRSVMRAIVQHAYGSPRRLRLEEVEAPLVDDDGVLVRVRGASVNLVDRYLMRGQPYLVHLTDGLLRPKVPIRGVDVAGVVEAVGGNVTQFRPGDAVFGHRRAAFAEYVCGTEANFVPLPAGLTFEQAAAIPVAGYTALQGLRDKGQVLPGQQVLINGASGGVGTFAVQIAKALGAEVTGVCSARNVELVQSLGAEHVIDYSQQDFTRTGQKYDLIFDAVGNRSLRSLRRALRPTGTLIIVGAPKGRWIGPLAPMVKALVMSRFARQRLVPFIAQHKKEDLLALKDLIEAGKVKPVIDRTYPLNAVPEAIGYLEGGHARGKVVITV
jgi:NADPH:quinone reductase-like Zn-dependent oxidoreductase